MIRAFSLSVISLILTVVPLRAATLQIQPATIALHGPHGSQRLVVVTSVNKEATADKTATTTFATSNAKVATVDAKGIVRAAGDGEATITATAGKETAIAKVTVKGPKADFSWGYRNHITPILTRLGCNSGACHGALAGKGGMKLSLRGYDPFADHFVLTRQAKGRRIDREAPTKSLMLLKPTMATSHGGGQRLDLDTPEYKVVSEWIADGARGPKKTDARIRRLEVFPAAAVLKPKDTARLVVRAWYSDGTAQDVTRLARFASSEDLVAGVNTEGKVTVVGHGEAAISVMYSNLVASARFISPFPGKVDPKVYKDAARNNAIDGLVLKKLARLNLPPSPTCSDSEFIRRAYLDAAGILPKPAEVRKFLADKSTNKRAKLVDALLERGEFTDYWAYKWSDMLLVTTRRLPQPAVWSFHSFVRQSVADNKPWDRFARDILTASGSTLKNGAGNYFVLHKDVSDLTESTAVTFLGMSITCARCHNHPLEKWTQDQYWSLANLFSRVGMKDGDRNGEVFVQSLDTGDALHPRRGIAMSPTPLDGKALSLDSTADRRAYFVKWLTGADNPYFAKALVNRVWRNFLGRGLVEAEDDLRETNPPTNDELFDHLAKSFIKNKFDIKKLIRDIMLSATYQRSATPLPGNAADDRFYSRYLVRRLSAEVLLDAYSQVTGVPTKFTHLNTNARDAMTPYAGFPAGTRALQLPDSLVSSRFLDAFGRPDRSQTCSCERSQDSSVGQALHLNNGRTLNDKLRDKKSLVQTWIAKKRTNADAVKELYLAALCRAPSVKELGAFDKLIEEAEKDGTRREALEDLAWAVLTSKEFVFNR